MPTYYRSFMHHIHNSNGHTECSNSHDGNNTKRVKAHGEPRAVDVDEVAPGWGDTTIVGKTNAIFYCLDGTHYPSLFFSDRHERMVRPNSFLLASLGVDGHHQSESPCGVAKQCRRPRHKERPRRPADPPIDPWFLLQVHQPGRPQKERRVLSEVLYYRRTILSTAVKTMLHYSRYLQPHYMSVYSELLVQALLHVQPV